MSQTDKISRNNTSITTAPDGARCITLHSTVILQYWPDDRKVRVCTGGWYTVTTRTRLTQAFNEWCLPLRVDFTQKTGNRLVVLERDCITGGWKEGQSIPFSRDDIAYANF